MDTSDNYEQVISRCSSRSSLKASNEWGWFVEEDEMGIGHNESKEEDEIDKEIKELIPGSGSKVQRTESQSKVGWIGNGELGKVNSPSYQSSFSSVSFGSSKNLSSHLVENSQDPCILEEVHQEEVYNFDNIKREDFPADGESDMLYLAGKCIIFVALVAMFRRLA